MEATLSRMTGAELLRLGEDAPYELVPVSTLFRRKRRRQGEP